jgi:hypothetical protein
MNINTLNAGMFPNTIANAFRNEIRSTLIEGFVGEVMIAAEKAAKHTSKLPNGAKAMRGENRKSIMVRRGKVLELANYLEGKPPQSSKALGVALKCTRPTAASRAEEAIKQGLIRKVPGKGHSIKNPVFAYEVI